MYNSDVRTSGLKLVKVSEISWTSWRGGVDVHCANSDVWEVEIAPIMCGPATTMLGDIPLILTLNVALSHLIAGKLNGYVW